MFWQVSNCEPGGDPAGATDGLHHVRLAGSAFFIFGFPDTRLYADICRSSVWYLRPKRFSSNDRSIGAIDGASSGRVAGLVHSALAVISKRSESTHFGAPTNCSLFVPKKALLSLGCSRRIGGWHSVDAVHYHDGRRNLSLLQLQAELLVNGFEDGDGIARFSLAAPLRRSAQRMSKFHAPFRPA